MTLIRSACLALLAMTSFACPARADLIFSDNFDAGASPSWGNEPGTWVAGGGVYYSTVNNNAPTVDSSLPFGLRDYSIDVDIDRISDGGIWMRSTVAPGTSIGRSGVLLVTGGDGGRFGGLYWHIIENGQYPTGTFGAVGGLFTPGVSGAHITVEVLGDVYSAYVNGTFITSITTGAFASGRVALYDNSDQTFDNVEVRAVPEPGSLMMAGTGSVCLLAFSLMKRTRRR